MDSVYVKVVGVDADFDGIPVTPADTIQSLKGAILKSRGYRLKDAIAADLRVYYVGNDPPESDEVDGLPLKVGAKLAAIVGDHDTPHFLVSSQRITELRAPPARPQWLSSMTAEMAKSVVTNILPDASFPEARPDPVLTGNALSPDNPLANILGRTIDTVEPPPLPPPIETPIPSAPSGATTRFAAHVRDIAQAEGLAIHHLTPKPEEHDIVREAVDYAHQYGHVGAAAIERLRTAAIQIAKELPKEGIVWVADGTASSGELFHEVPLEEISEYCATHNHCFESTRHLKHMRFFLDLDGYAPNCRNPAEFREVQNRVLQGLIQVFGGCASIMTSSRFRAEIQPIGPLGTTRKKIVNRLSYRITFRNVVGTRSAMDTWAVREVLPRMRLALGTACTVVETAYADGIKPPESGAPCIAVDRWVYTIGDRLRMLGSTKELENRPFVAVGDTILSDTLLGGAPPDALVLPENHDPRVSIWK